jgi:subtilisin family serine protease
MLAQRTLLLRRAAFERFEQRLVMTAAPWADFATVCDAQLPEPKTTDRAAAQHAIAAPPLSAMQLDGTPGGELANQRGDQFGARQPGLADGVQVWQRLGLDGSGQTVAVIDSGIAYEHQALGGGFGPGFRVVAGHDFTEEQDGDPHDDGPAGFHGTHVAGIIASSDPAHPGLAPGVDLVALRVFNDQGVGSFPWLEEALRWVHDHHDTLANPITTVNLSVGGIWNSPDIPEWANLEDELQQLRDDGIVVVVAAGNSFAGDAPLGLSYPASSPLVIPVASTAGDGTLSHFSQRDPRVVAAPGERIESTIPDHVYGADGRFNDWAETTGTSMAAPHVTAAAVLVRQALQLAGQSPVTPEQIYEHLRQTADFVWDPDSRASYARLNLEAALRVLEPRLPDRSSGVPASDPQPEVPVQIPSTPAVLPTAGTLLDFPAELLHTALPAPSYATNPPNVPTILPIPAGEQFVSPPVKAEVIRLTPTGTPSASAGSGHVVQAGDPPDVCRAPAPPQPLTQLAARDLLFKLETEALDR